MIANFAEPEKLIMLVYVTGAFLFIIAFSILRKENPFRTVSRSIFVFTVLGAALGLGALAANSHHKKTERLKLGAEKVKQSVVNALEDQKQNNPEKLE